MKQCYGCKLYFSLDCFTKDKTKKDGFQSKCVECRRKCRRDYYLKNRKKYLDRASGRKKDVQKWWKEYKSQFVCSECGESHQSCIQFHHIDDNKEEAVSKLVAAGSKKRALSEIHKCIPLCANCHFKLHWKEKNRTM